MGPYFNTLNTLKVYQAYVFSQNDVNPVAQLQPNLHSLCLLSDESHVLYLFFFFIFFLLQKIRMQLIFFFAPRQYNQKIINLVPWLIQSQIQFAFKGLFRRQSAFAEVNKYGTSQYIHHKAFIWGRVLQQWNTKLTLECFFKVIRFRVPR